MEASGRQGDTGAREIIVRGRKRSERITMPTKATRCGVIDLALPPGTQHTRRHPSSPQTLHLDIVVIVSGYPRLGSVDARFFKIFIPSHLALGQNFVSGGANFISKIRP